MAGVKERVFPVLRARMGRLGTLAAVTVLLASQAFVGAASAAKSTSKVVLIGSSVGASGVNDPGPAATGQANLTFTPVSAGNMTFFDVVVKNAGGQSLNNIQLSVGYDSNADPESGRPVTLAVTPTFPVAFPVSTGVTLSSFSPAGTTCAAADASVGRIDCVVGTLSKGASFKLQVVLATSIAGNVPVKAVTKAAENSNDNGGNQDTFAAEGTLPIGAFSCDSSSAYLPGSAADKTIGTCPIGTSGNANKQSFGVKFPARLTTVTLKEDGTADLCPVSDCFGTTFVADITDDAATDTITWTVSVDLVAAGKTNLNLNKLVIYHYADGDTADADAVAIANTNKNVCKTTSQKDCVVALATITNDILTVSFQTAGNGSTRLH
jgi:hypothetical protein